MSDVPTGYALTVLACKLGLYPPEVEGNTEDGFRVTDPETGYSIEWEPHRNVQQARTVFWDLVPLCGCDVTAYRGVAEVMPYQGWVKITHPSLPDECWMQTYWGRETYRTEAEALLRAACLAVQALRRL